MTHELRPVDLSAPRIEPCRWCVTWPSDDAGHWREAYFAQRPLADAYAASHRGAIIVPLAALVAWPATARAGL